VAKVLARRIKGGSFFKLLLVGSVITHTLMTLLVMILVALGFIERPLSARSSHSPVRKLEIRILMSALVDCGGQLTERSNIPRIRDSEFPST